MAAASISEKICSLAGIIEKTNQWKREGKKIVFTNGVFDLLHKGHIFSLTQAAKEGDVLVIGLNSDCSVKRLKEIAARSMTRMQELYTCRFIYG
jgi:D-beta-D-heptose 7-phosphate kinase/D-beta-D-heptose 1-phosphate adenosyltransferase